jgi:hypothetical protein
MLLQPQNRLHLLGVNPFIETIPVFLPVVEHRAMNPQLFCQCRDALAVLHPLQCHQLERSWVLVDPFFRAHSQPLSRLGVVS